jgi:predicted patatin/cPLA2 family phospholipase
MHIVKRYVKNLINNLPQVKNPEDINLVLDGGIFNGSYLIGALHFLKEMELKKYIQIHKISCCSISSVCVLLYKMDALDIFPDLYNIILKQFKETRQLSAFEKCIVKIRSRIDNPAELLSNINGSLFITYHNITKGKKIVKSKYTSIDDLLETIYRSCFVPFVVNGSMVRNNKYFDGVNPHILPVEHNKKTLYLDLFGYDKINYLLSVKNEKTNFHRILAGLLDIHLFYIKQNNTQMCSYVNKWSLYQTFHNRVLKWIVERAIYYSVYIVYYLKKYIPIEFYEHIIFKIISKIITELYTGFIDYYCF